MITKMKKGKWDSERYCNNDKPTEWYREYEEWIDRMRNWFNKGIWKIQINIVWKDE